MLGSRGVREGRVAAAAVVLVAAVAMAGAGAAAARQPFRPRIGRAMGIEPVHGAVTTPSGGPAIPEAYHGGSVMRNVTIHTIFWAPAGYHFDGAPGPGTLGYQALVQQFFADVAHDSGGTSNIFSTLNQYGDRSGPSTYSLHYDPTVDSVAATDPYPAQSHQCVSPSGIATCLTDAQVQREVDKLIGAGNTAGRGLSNVWFVLLPPDVDECISLGACGTTAFAGYHSEFDLGHGVTVYSPVPDPQIEFTPPPGSDPQGNPEAEETIDTVAHEAIEAVTNPLGNAWMDPNGFEVADKCENGPQQGAPLGYAADGAPFNQLINGHQYLIQDVWANSRLGCVQSSSTVASIPALHTVSLRQYSSGVSGSTGVRGRVPVTVGLIRANAAVALARTVTRPDGSWGPVTLRGTDGRPHAVGDDRDLLEILYGFGRTPPPDQILTGDGGNPFTESGWTGWYELDHGYAVHSTGGGATITTAPCGQTGVLTLAVGSTLTESPASLCSSADAAVVHLGRLGAGTPVTFSTEDNRGEYALRPDGTLVRLTVSLGEPNSISSVSNGQVPFVPTGFPVCTAFLRIRTVRCSGLVPGAAYRLLRTGHTVATGRAGSAGAVTVAGLAIRGGDVLTLVNSAGRRLTSLHVAHLRVDLIGNQTVIASGTCQGGDYWGPPVAKLPISAGVGAGIGDSGTICPSSGRAKGLSTADIAQTDDFSGGQTIVQVPDIQSTAPIQDETLYGPFVASAQSGLPGPHGSVSAAGVPIALTITAAGSRHRVFHAANVDTPRGVAVPALAPGSYVATWVLHDAAGDTRTLTTRFADEA